jgi:KUP system potassium uptake protein
MVELIAPVWNLAVTRANAFGVASVVFWALVVIISIRYLLLVMRAANNGEGGILALTALLMPTRGLPVARSESSSPSACSGQP